MDPVAIAAAHLAAIAALEAAGEATHAEVLRVQGTDLLRLARLGQAKHDENSRDPAKAETEPLIRNARNHA